MSHTCVYQANNHPCKEAATHAVVGHSLDPAHCQAMTGTFVPESRYTTVVEFCGAHAETVSAHRNTAWQEASTHRKALKERLTHLRNAATLEP